MGTVSESIRRYLPTQVRLVRGAIGAVGGGALVWVFFFRLFRPHRAYLTGFTPWYLLTALTVGLVGICAAVWYVMGRPLVFRLLESTAERVTYLSPRFGRGMLLAVLGGALPLVVTGGSRPWLQAFGILGVLLLTIGPLWYWVVVAVEWPWRDRWSDALPTPSGRRAVLAGGMVLVAASIALTPVLGLPLSAVGETATGNGLAVTITDVQRTHSTVGGGVQGRNVTAGEDTELLVVEFTFENRAGEPRELPSFRGYESPTALYSPACGDRLYPTCPAAPIDGNFTVGDREYEEYNMFLTLTPDEEYTGTEVYEVPARSDGGERPQFTFVVRDIGRWDLSG